MRKPAPALGSPLVFTGYIRIRKIYVVTPPPPPPPPSVCVLRMHMSENVQITWDQFTLFPINFGYFASNFGNPFLPTLCKHQMKATISVVLLKLILKHIVIHWLWAAYLQNVSKSYLSTGNSHRFHSDIWNKMFHSKFVIGLLAMYTA